MALLHIPTIFGVSLEVYLLLIILGIPVFFIWRWILKKFIEDNKKRIITTWIVAIITTPFVYAGIIVLILLAMSYYPTHSFNQAEWLENKNKRYQISDDIIDSNMLIGKTKAEVKQILGDEGNPDESDHWTYYLGYKPGFISIDPDVLDIDFKDGKVVKVGQHET